MRNMDIKAGHCNGTRYLIKHIGQYRLVLEKLHAEEGDKNKILILPRIPMKHAMSDKFAFELTRLQFPIKIALLSPWIELKDSLQKSVEFYCQNTYGLMVKFMLHSLDVETPTTYMYGQNSLCSKKHDLDPNKRYAANVVYSEVLQDEDSDRW